MNSALKQAIKTLKAGGVIVFPTETSYGLGCDATNAKAVQRVFEMKGRPSGKGTPLIVDALATAEHWGRFSPTAKKLAKEHWPGPLTLVVPVKGKIVPAVLQDNTVALRVSSNAVARALAKGLGRPLVATSANLAGAPASYSIRTFLRQIPTGADGLFDVGALPKRKATTLVRVIGDRVEVLRQGKIRL